jgi:hypothetical protein
MQLHDKRNTRPVVLAAITLLAKWQSLVIDCNVY